jgi:hypothetical protein
MAGFIYIMSNAAFASGLIKIGKSSKDPEDYRKNELETTGVPEPFVVEYYAFVDEYDKIESELHSQLDSVRPNNNREFFNFSIPETINLIREVSGKRLKYEKLLYQSEDEIEKIQKRKEKDDKLKKYRKELDDARILLKNNHQLLVSDCENMIDAALLQNNSFRKQQSSISLNILYPFSRPLEKLFGVESIDEISERFNGRLKKLFMTSATSKKSKLSSICSNPYMEINEAKKLILKIKEYKVFFEILFLVRLFEYYKEGTYWGYYRLDGELNGEGVKYIGHGIYVGPLSNGKYDGSGSILSKNEFDYGSGYRSNWINGIEDKSARKELSSYLLKQNLGEILYINSHYQVLLKTS